VEAIFEEWDRVADRDLSDDMMRLTIWIVGETLFHQDFRKESEQIGHALEACLAQATLLMISMGMLQPWMPTPGNRKAKAEEETLNRIVRSLIHHHRENPGPGMLSRILTATDEETGEGMTEQQVVDEVKSLILAGHETTSLALSWTFYLLSSHPEVEARLQAESDRVLGGRAPTAEDMPKLEFTRMVFLETMRLYPPVPVVTRVAREADHFDGIDIAAGEKTVINLYATQRHPAFWSNPEVFDPDRFSAERAAVIQPYAYLPFLLGRRACLGEHFAMIEGVAALAMIAGRYTMKRLDADTIGTRPISTLRLDRPLRMRVARRS
jgi:cytochrome P450